MAFSRVCSRLSHNKCVYVAVQIRLLSGRLLLTAILGLKDLVLGYGGGGGVFAVRLRRVYLPPSPRAVVTAAARARARV